MLSDDTDLPSADMSDLRRTMALACTLALAACGGDDSAPAGDTDDVADTSIDATGDTEPADTAEPDVAPDVPEPDVGEDTDATADADVVEDTGPDVELPECDPPLRLVGERCRREFDRICVTDDDCRSTERCEDVRDDGYGTCLYQVPDPTICPGSPSCATADGPLRAGFAARTITPTGWELGRPGNEEDPDAYGTPRTFSGDITVPRTFCDCGTDFICPPDDLYADCRSFGEYTGPDANGTEGDGLMQGTWIAGFGNNRNAQPCPPELLADTCEGNDCCEGELYHDHLWARGFVLEQGDARVAYVVVDTVGYFYSEGQRIVQDLDPALGIDTLIVASTHSHEGPDTMGRWGPGVYGSGLPTDSGIVPTYMAYIREQIVDVVEEAVTSLEPVDLYAAQANTGSDGFAARDSRDPFVFYDLVTTLHFVRAGGDRTDPAQTVGTVVNWHSHPEALGNDNPYLTSDFPHYIRHYVENGFAEEAVEPDGTVHPAMPGLGGINVYISGTVGGLLTPLSWEVVARDGTVIREESYDKAEALGARVAEVSLLSLATPCDDGPDYGCSTQVTATDLSFATQEVMLPVENVQFQTAAISLGLFDREVYNWRADDGTFGDYLPYVVSALSQLRIGNVGMQTFPGELFPEVIVGGYRQGDVRDNAIQGNPRRLDCAEDGVTPATEDAAERFPCIVRPDNPNPPALELAPEGPYVRDTVPTDYLVVLGLSNDALGYIVPPYDFKVDPIAGALVEVDGDHYEETVSIGDVLDTYLAIIDDLTDALDAAR